MSYKIKLDIFEGPLDLLLYLIKKDDLDISKVSLARVTEQYLSYIETMEMLDLEIVGDFLVTAATLIQIKSKMLLPPDPAEVEEEEDVSSDLLQRLQEYKKFKEAANQLQMYETSRKDLFGRNMVEEDRQKILDESKEVFFEANLFDLINALSEALRRAPEEVIHEIIREEYTVEEKIHDMLHLMVSKPSVRVNDLFKKCRSKSEMIVTFLAILELIRLKEIKVCQKQVFGEIDIMRNTDKMEASASPESTLDSDNQA